MIFIRINLFRLPLEKMGWVLKIVTFWVLKCQSEASAIWAQNSQDL